MVPKDCIMASEDYTNPDGVSSSDDELQQSLVAEDNFVCELINTIPSSCYFDQDARDQLSRFKHEATDLKMLQTAGKKRGREIREEIKNKFAKLDPEQNKSVTQTIMQLHLAETGDEKKKLGNQWKNKKPEKAESLQSLQKRLRERMETIQQNKIKGIPDSELNEAQLTRRNKRKLNRQRAKERKKQAAKDSKYKMNNNLRPKIKTNTKLVNGTVKPIAEKSKPIFNKEGKMVFSKFDFAGDKTKKKKNQLAGKDYKGLLEKVTKAQQKVKDLAETDAEKAKELEQKQAWKSALQKSEGIKVKDDPELLKKAIKKKEQKKRKSEKQWKKREGHVEKMKSDKQTKRRENIQKRASNKKDAKLKKAIKKGRVVPGFS